jgi:acyl-coenzyme A thioesterase PaaI-like protein
VIDKAFAVRRAIQAAAKTRVQGMHLLGHFIGMTGRPAPLGTARLTIWEPVGDVPVPLLSYCPFVDMTLMSAIRSHFGAGRRLGTVTLSVQHPTQPVRGAVIGVAQASAPVGPHGSASGEFLVGGEVIGRAVASANAIDPPPGRVPALLPWEREPLPSPAELTRAELDAFELQFVAAVEQAVERALVNGTSVEDELIDFAWEPSAVGIAVGELAIGSQLANRVRQLQGGAVYAAGARAALQAVGQGWALSDGHYQFLRPGEGERLRAEARVLRTGRAVAYTETKLSVDGVLVGAGLYTFRPSATV